MCAGTHARAAGGRGNLQFIGVVHLEGECAQCHLVVGIREGGAVQNLSELAAHTFCRQLHGHARGSHDSVQLADSLCSTLGHRSEGAVNTVSLGGKSTKLALCL